ncbi:MAG: GWxTD domain-containing protein [candidate division WOR-3 bacterium]
MNLFLEIPVQSLKFVNKDSVYIASYEIQLTVFDNKGNQLTGDYWFREKLKDTVNFYDSLNLVIPKTAKKYNLRVIDLQGIEVLNINETIKNLDYLVNIRHNIRSDTLLVTFTIINEKSINGELDVSLENMKITRPLKPGIYEDSVHFFVAIFPNGGYQLRFVVKEQGKKIEELTVPFEIERPFYLDEKAWYLKVSQLEYIATPGEINQLRKAQIEERDSLWKAFWKKYDPTPNTEYNEKEAEYFERIAYAEEHFSFGDKGWRSDRGRIYVKFGPPDEVVSRPYELSTKPYEIWYYYRLNLKFVFYDRHGFGEYILVNPQGERI